MYGKMIICGGEGNVVLVVYVYMQSYYPYSIYCGWVDDVEALPQEDKWNSRI